MHNKTIASYTFSYNVNSLYLIRITFASHDLKARQNFNNDPIEHIIKIIFQKVKTRITTLNDEKHHKKMS